MPIKALIFDFDGLILDTETAEYLAWRAIYDENGFEFPHEEWGKIVGGYGLSDFDAAEHLSLLSHGRLDSTILSARHRLDFEAALAQESVLPSVLDLIQEAKTADLKLAIASSSPHAWVDGHAQRLGIFHYFDKVICSEDVGFGKTKPNPDLFLTALNQLQIQKNEAVVFEDSPNGVRAANRAGIFVVAVPNQVTSSLVIEGANLILSSLSELSLNLLIDKVK